MPSPTLRPYQADSLTRVRQAWTEGSRRVLLSLPTGAGKTVILARVVAEHAGYSMVVAHRRELISQISLALAREGVTHEILAPHATVRQIVRAHVRVLGHSTYSPTARVCVASVDILPRAPAAMLDRVSLWVIDEGHHVLAGNKWGRALARLPTSARGLGVTATPCRADRRGLHLSYDRLIVGPQMRDLIREGYLAEYRVFAPPSRIDLSSVSVSAATGDFSAAALRREVAHARIHGDVVRHYLAHAAGRRGVTFAVDVASARELADAYDGAGVPALVVHASTPALEREDAVRALECGEILQLVNVDLFGEGFDLPAIDVVSMARPTHSYPLFVRQFGRALRPAPGKSHALILDHVGNVERHGLPDFSREWTLAGGARNTATEKPELQIRVCLVCAGAYERLRVSCPYCGHEYEPSDRSHPRHVDGDLTLLDLDALRQLYDHVARTDRSDYAVRREYELKHMPEIGIRRMCRLHRETQQTQVKLRSALDDWASDRRAAGLSDREIQRVFWLRYGVDLLSARALRHPDARALIDTICGAHV